MRGCKVLYFQLLALISILSCKPKPLSNHENKSPNSINVSKEFRDAFAKTNILVDPAISYYVLIPGTGCGGCINSAEEFLKTNLHEHQKVKFILTKINSLKLLKLKLGINIYDKEIILDTSDNFSFDHLYTIYPTVYYMNGKGDIDSIRDSKDGGFDQFTSRIK